METSLHTYCLIIIVFLIYFSVSYLFNLLSVNNIEKALQINKGLQFLNLRHSIGILLFGVTFLCLNPDSIKLLLTFEFLNVQLVLLCIVIVFLAFYLSRVSVKKTINKHSTVTNLYIGNGIVYFFLRSLFLLAYEFFFRGILLFALIDLYGLVFAVIINTLLYVLIHAFDSKTEIIGAIPFGVVLCLMSYYSQSVLLAFIIHLSLSLVYEVTLFNFFNSLKNKS